jgi:hypothetical protein
MSTETKRETGDTDRDARFLKGAALGLTVLLAAVSVAAATQQPRFEEISAERINIVEPDGTPRLILYNSSHTPGAILYGKDHPHPNRSPHAGMLYFNDEGTENGGHLTFDQFDQDQVVSLVGGLRVWDQPYMPIAQLLDRVQAARAKPEGQERTRAMEEVSAWARAQGIFRQRLRAQTTRDKSAVIELADTLQRPRLRMVVDSSGSARLEFLGDGGQVMRAITGGAR